MADSTDWTVVLREPCIECGQDIRNIRPDQLATALQDSVDNWIAVLTGQDSDPVKLATRPNPETWSPIEYASHVTDVMDLFQERIYLMITEDNPTFASFDPDAAAAAYADRSASQTAALLGGAANRLGDVFATMAPHLWARTGKRGDGAEFSVLSLSRYFMHDNLHHLHDVQQQLGA
jgi:hypothetical protein